MKNMRTKEAILTLISFGVGALILNACSPSVSASLTPAPTLESESTPLFSEDLSTDQLTDEVLVTIYERVNPGVVSITIYSDSLFVGQGSGFVLDSNGHILTNYHVIEDATDIEITFPSGYHVRADVVGTDLDSDIAVLKVNIPAEELFPLPLGSSSQVKVGQSVVAIGNPYGLSGTIAVGIVSAKGRILDSMRTTPSGFYFSSADLIQTDAAINPGNSGGPLLNLNGEVIGINRAIRTNGDGETGVLANSGIGFAVPIDIVKHVVPFLIRDGSYNYPYLGIVSRENLTLAEREALGLPADAMGAYVLDVPAGSPADRAGLVGGNRLTEIPDLYAGGDLITMVDGQQVRDFSDLLTYLVTNKIPGDELNLTIVREGRESQITVVLDQRPE